ncbi:hypothetical protein LshimejAT787_2600330 [Lyophyllum shimeji]|uniref:F-box domain-containing protein n=1 Tax=Lyophyllum shimeji TaxID=47721 RepID=A0A9P3UVB0_LYOSH|nr:hypothetical protein LshimejAT787_2600330 [Lyophyllum shimeji]
MHPCLNLTEIQAVIFGHLSNPDLQVNGDPLPDFATLASVARTCTAFTEVALDALWRDQTSLAPLLQVMPADLWLLRIEAQASTWEVPRLKILTFVRDLQEADWSRFDYYAPKIRRLLGSMFTSEPVYPDETVFHSLRSYRPSHPLLPNLATLHIHIIHPKHFQRMPLMLLSPTITTLDIFVLDPHPHEVPAFLSDAARTCPDIRNFRFRVSVPAVIDTLAFNEALAALLGTTHNVEVFDIHTRVPTTSDVIWQLGNSAALCRCETISLPPGLGGSEIQRFFSSGQGRFSKLRHFVFEAPDLDMAADVIAALQCPLKSLHTYVGKQVLQPHSALARFMASFERHRCVSSLTTLSITGSPEIDGPSDSIRGAFRSLFSLAALKSLHLRLSCASELDDDWLAGAAPAWPRLRELLIYHSDPPKVTLAGLIPLIRHCPRLSDFWISIAARPFDSDLLLPGICNTRIATLDLNLSTIVAPVGVFRCLVLMFPKLKTIFYFDEGEGEEGWARVSSLLKESMEDEDEG